MPWEQIAAIVVIATIAAWLIRFWSPSPWNAIILLLPAITIASVANKGAAQFFFAAFLTLIAVVTMLGNEAAAHLVFGTCLYD